MPPTSRHINNILKVYLFLDSEPQLGKSKELNNQGMIAEAKRVFKSHSFTKNTRKRDRLCLKFFSKTIQLCRGVSIPYLKINVSYLSNNI